MYKCKNPNLIYFKNHDEEDKHRVVFIPGGKKDYSEDFKKHLIDSGAIEVPCGQCAACRLEYSRIWANRCYLESLCHKFTWFITLSYRDDSLVYGDKDFPTLEKDAISLFIRKVRDRYGHNLNIRYFGCGEYGDRTMRPHYHLILFGAPISDLDINMPDMSKEKLPSGQYPIFRRKNSNGDYVFFSQTIYDCWEKGKIEVENAGWNCAAYVSRYVMKKQKGVGAQVYKRLGILPEYIRMSTKPGIGFNWLLEHKEDLLKYDYLSVKNNAGVQTTRPPRYFEKMMLKIEDSKDWWLMNSNKITRIINAKTRFVEECSKKSVGAKSRDASEFYEKKSKLLQRDIT